MIKGISFLRPVGSAAAYDRLASFFSALGFALGKGWEDDHPNDEDLSLHPSEQRSLAGDPESLGTPAGNREQKMGGRRLVWNGIDQGGTQLARI